MSSVLEIYDSVQIQCNAHDGEINRLILWPEKTAPDIQLDAERLFNPYLS